MTQEAIKPGLTNNGDGTWRMSFGEDSIILTEAELKSVLAPWPDKTEAQLRQLADEIYRNLIFTSHHVRSGDRDILGSIFMPLLFTDDVFRAAMRYWNIDFIYEYYDKAGPMSINGYPIFSSCKVLPPAQAQEVIKYVRERNGQEPHPNMENQGREMHPD